MVAPRSKTTELNACVNVDHEPGTIDDTKWGARAGGTRNIHNVAGGMTLQITQLTSHSHYKCERVNALCVYDMCIYNNKE